MTTSRGQSTVKKTDVPPYVSEANELGWKVYEDPEDGSANFVKRKKRSGDEKGPRIELEWEPDSDRERNLERVAKSKPRSGDPMLECRSIWRGGDHLSVYPSSQAGCEMGCSFCWLTENRSNSKIHATLQDFDEQLRLVLSHHRHFVETGKRNFTPWVYVNFMARGDALNNPTILKNYDLLYQTYEARVRSAGMKLKMNVSSIFPKAALSRFAVRSDSGSISHYELAEIFKDKPVSLYVSLYSADPEVRKKHLPGAADVDAILDSLRIWQTLRRMPDSRQREVECNNETELPEKNESLDAQFGNLQVDRTEELAFHGAVVRGLNDSDEAIAKLANAVKSRNLNAKVNVVRFNPHPRSSLTEGDDKARDKFLEEMSRSVCDVRGKSKHHQRVAINVFGSCGEFFPDDELY